MRRSKQVAKDHHEFLHVRERCTAVGRSERTFRNIIPVAGQSCKIRRALVTKVSPYVPSDSFALFRYRITKARYESIFAY